MPATLMLGTTKGAFLRDGDESRRAWTLRGPFCGGWPVNRMAADPATGTIWAAGGNDFLGAGVWRTRDAGATWEAQRDGLSGQNCFFTVLRQAMATDCAAEPGVDFGTNPGSVFASRDGGAHWDEIARHLPTVLCVETLSASA